MPEYYVNVYDTERHIFLHKQLGPFKSELEAQSATISFANKPYSFCIFFYRPSRDAISVITLLRSGQTKEWFRLNYQD